ncbi:unnamed protein product [Rotaria sp. Silwood1]|nr:unnamed protein product [Rotaria sp. Silwood1]
MHNNLVFIEQVNENNEQCKWWHHRWFKIICICFIIVAIVAIVLSLVLKFVIFAPKKQDITTATLPSPTTMSSSMAVSSSTAVSSSSTAVSSSSSTAVSSSRTATTPLTTAATTTRPSGKLYTGTS